MGTEQAAISQDIIYKVDGQVMTLNVTTRAPLIDMPLPKGDTDKLYKILPATVKVWLAVYRAIRDGNAPDFTTMKSACRSIEVEASLGDPYCTVWNKSSGQSITVHSWDDGSYAYAQYQRHQQGIAMLSEYADKLGLEDTQAKSPAPKTIEPDFSKSPAHQAQQGSIPNIFVRETAKSAIPQTIALVKQKGGNDTALVATKPYDYQATVEADAIVVYELQGDFSVIAHSDGTKAISIPVVQGNSIHIRYSEDNEWQGKTIPSDWSRLVQHLGYKDRQDELYVGFHGFLSKAKYIAMKFKADGNWKNYHGLFSALPDSNSKAS